MTPAESATANAIHFEGVKVAYRQTKDGVVISFVVHPHDVPKGLAEAPLGSRYIVALVQVGDDEQPVPAKETAATPQPASDKPLAGAKRVRPWRELQPSAQAYLLCEKPVFHAFLKEQYPDEWHESMTDAAECVRLICAVASRAFLNDGAPRVIWHQLNGQYDLWALKERVGV